VGRNALRERKERPEVNALFVGDGAGRLRDGTTTADAIGQKQEMLVPRQENLPFHA
jgi:hypothetical protein